MVSPSKQQCATQETTDVGEDAEKGEPSCTVGGNANWCSHSGKQLFLKQKAKNRATLDPAIALPGIYPNDIKILILRDT